MMNKNYVRNIYEPDFSNNETGRKILEAASELFFLKGYNRTTMRDIASAAEVNLALVNYHFKSKSNLAQIIGKSMMNDLRKRMLKETEVLELSNIESIYLENVLLWIYTAEEKAVEDFYVEFLIDTSECDTMTVNYYNQITGILKEHGIETDDRRMQICWSVFKGSEKELVGQKWRGELDISYIEMNEILMTNFFVNLGIPAGELKELIERHEGFLNKYKTV